MAYLVVCQFDRARSLCHCVKISESGDFNMEGDLGWLPLSQVGLIVMQNQFRPLNFSLDRHGSVVTDCGDFSRFADSGCAVVLAEIKTTTGRTLGYRLLSCSTLVILNKVTQDIVDLANNQTHPFLQNGIIRNKTVNCYPLHPYPVMTVGTETRKRVSHPVAEKPTKKASKVQEFTEEQLKEIKRCRENGLNSKFIENPALSPQQMRVLWVSKSKGAYAEAFASPKYSVDVMKFYADRIMNTAIAKECEAMLAKPDLTTDKLAQLYLCVCYGVKFDDLLDLDVTSITTKRQARTVKFWSGSEVTADDLYDKAIAFAEKMRGIR